MSNSGENGDESGEPLSHWRDCFRRFAAAAGAPAMDLDAAWRGAVDSWWQGVAAGAPAHGRELLEPAVDQGKAFIALANEVGRKPATGGHAFGPEQRRRPQ